MTYVTTQREQYSSHLFHGTNGKQNVHYEKS